MFGALHYALHTTGKQDALPANLRRKLDAEGLIERLAPFIAAGMRTPVPATNKTFC